MNKALVELINAIDESNNASQRKGNKLILKKVRNQAQQLAMRNWTHVDSLFDVAEGSRDVRSEEDIKLALIIMGLLHVRFHAITQNEIYLVAAYLNINYSTSRLTREEVRKAEEILERKYEHFINVIDRVDEDMTEDPYMMREEPLLFPVILEEINKNRKNNGNIDLFKYYYNHQIPFIRWIAVEYLIVPCSSCSAERFFSLLKLIVTSRRERLDSRLIEMMSLMSFNFRFMDPIKIGYQAMYKYQFQLN